MTRIERQINSLNPKWGTKPFTYAEMMEATSNKENLESFTKDDWKTLREFMAAELTQIESRYFLRPKTRINFIRFPKSYRENALGWRQRNPKQS